MAIKTIFCLAFLVTLLNCSNEKTSTKESLSGQNNISEIREIKRKSGFEMIKIEGGDFIMGGNDIVDDGGLAENRIADECPHKVFIKDFSIGQYEVTQVDWLEIMGTNPSQQKNCGDCPVENVSWENIQEFIRKLNLKHGESYRLPTEEEWEFAARGGVKSKNYMYSGSSEAIEVAWFNKNSNGISRPVGLLKSNELELFDMSGNIWEWCNNAKIPYSCDTIGKVFESKVLRGGSFSHRMSSVRVRDRNGRDPSLRLPTLGFRLAK